jgi:hypothetical protein
MMKKAMLGVKLTSGGQDGAKEKMQAEIDRSVEARRAELEREEIERRMLEREHEAQHTLHEVSSSW